MYMSKKTHGTALEKHTQVIEDDGDSIQKCSQLQD